MKTDKEQIINKYNNLYDKHEVSSRSLGWGEKYRSNLRFFILTENWHLSKKKIIDFGCGFGDLYGYLKKNNIEVDYYGYDINENFISVAKRKFKADNNSHFYLKDLLADSITIEEFDYAFVSGTFNDKRKNNAEFFVNTLNMLNRITSRGISFNMLSAYADKKYDHAAYYHPSNILKICYRINKNIIFRNDYMPYEFTIHINKYSNISDKLTIYNEFYDKL